MLDTPDKLSGLLRIPDLMAGKQQPLLTWVENC